MLLVPIYMRVGPPSYGYVYKLTAKAEFKNGMQTQYICWRIREEPLVLVCQHRTWTVHQGGQELWTSRADVTLPGEHPWINSRGVHFPFGLVRCEWQP